MCSSRSRIYNKVVVRLNHVESRCLLHVSIPCCIPYVATLSLCSLEGQARLHYTYRKCWYRDVFQIYLFLPRGALHSADYAVARRLCPSVRSSVTRRSVETAKHILKLFSPSGSHAILVFFVPNDMAIFRRGSPNGGVEWTWSMKNRDFRPISRFSSEMIQYRAILTMADR